MSLKFLFLTCCISVLVAFFDLSTKINDLKGLAQNCTLFVSEHYVLVKAFIGCTRMHVENKVNNNTNVGYAFHRLKARIEVDPEEGWTVQILKMNTCKRNQQSLLFMAQRENDECRVLLVTAVDLGFQLRYGLL